MNVPPFQYQAYGLELASEIPLPELTCSTSTACADAVIEIGDLKPVPEDAVSVGPGQWASGDRVWLGSDRVAGMLGSTRAPRIMVEHGRRIVVEAGSEIELSAIRLYLLGNAIGALLHQRGFFVLHAGAVAVGDNVVAFAGFSGAGKSTMTAAMVDRGHEIVVDDVLAVDLTNAECPRAFSGFPQLKLYPEVTGTLGHPQSTLVTLHPDLPKLGHRPLRGFSHRSRRLSTIYILADSESESESPRIVGLTQAQAAIELIRHSYAVRIAAQEPGSGYGAKHLTQCSALVRSVSVRKLEHTRRLDELPTLALAVERDCAQT